MARYKDPTPEQRAKNEMGDIIKDANGKEIKSYFPYIVEILGLSQDESAIDSAKSRPY